MVLRQNTKTPWVMFLTAILLSLHSVSGLVYAQSSEPENIEKLLREADKALTNPRAAPPSEPRRRERAPTQRPQIPQTKDSAATPKVVRPVHDTGIEKIFRLDTHKAAEEARTPYPHSAIRVSMARDQVGRGYEMSKDDDTFRVSSGGLQGVILQFNPNWRLYEAADKRIRLLLPLTIATGLLSGELEAERSGVQNGVNTYIYNLFPIDGEIGMAVDMKPIKLQVQLMAGIGGEVLNQLGEGQSDSLSVLFHGDLISLRAIGYWYRPVELHAGWQWRGSGLLSSSTGFSGQMFTVGVGFNFAG